MLGVLQNSGDRQAVWLSFHESEDSFSIITFFFRPFVPVMSCWG